MKYTKIALLTVLVPALAFIGCAKEKVVEGPAQEYVTKNLAPSKVEEKGDKFVMVIDGLKVSMMVNSSTKAIMETPSLKGSCKITNTSKDLLGVQSVTLEYMDRAGTPIAFQSGEKAAAVSLMLSSLRPGDSSEFPLDVTFPRAAIKTLDRIKVNVVYVPSPLKRETLTLSAQIG